MGAMRRLEIGVTEQIAGGTTFVSSLNSHEIVRLFLRPNAKTCI